MSFMKMQITTQRSVHQEAVLGCCVFKKPIFIVMAPLGVLAPESLG